MTGGLGEPGYEADPANLRAGAADFQSAVAEDQQAARTIGMGATSSAGTVFGVSHQAQHLADKWNSAVAARVAAVNDLADQTAQQADLLLRTADEYDSAEEKNRDRARDVEGGLR
jgi:hypothetical protein